MNVRTVDPSNSNILTFTVQCYKNVSHPKTAYSCKRSMSPSKAELTATKVVIPECGHV